MAPLATFLFPTPRADWSKIYHTQNIYLLELSVPAAPLISPGKRRESPLNRTRLFSVS